MLKNTTHEAVTCSWKWQLNGYYHYKKQKLTEYYPHNDFGISYLETERDFLKTWLGMYGRGQGTYGTIKVMHITSLRKNRTYSLYLTTDWEAILMIVIVIPTVPIRACQMTKEYLLQWSLQIRGNSFGQIQMFTPEQAA